MRPEEFLFEVSRQLAEQGHTLDDDTLAEAYRGLVSPEGQQQLQQGQLTPEIVVREVQKGFAHLQARRAGTVVSAAGQPALGQQPDLAQLSDQGGSIGGVNLPPVSDLFAQDASALAGRQARGAVDVFPPQMDLGGQQPPTFFPTMRDIGGGPDAGMQRELLQRLLGTPNMPQLA